MSERTIFISLITFLYPAFTYLFYFFAIRVFGKNVWIIIPVISMCWIYILSISRKKKLLSFTEHDFILFLIFISASIVHLLRFFFLDQGRSYLDIRYVLTPFIFLLVFRRRIIEDSEKLFVARIVLLTCLLEAIIGIIMAHFFPNIYIDSENFVLKFDGQRTRQTGTLVSASLYANFILASMFLIVFFRNKGKSILNSLSLEIILLLVLYYGLSLSGSRYPMIWGIFLILFYLGRIFINPKKFLMFAILVLFSLPIVFLLEDIELHGILRLNENSGGRYDKLILPFQVLGLRSLFILIGATDLIAGTAVSENGIGISDNSYHNMSLQFGIPFAYLWYAYFFFFLGNRIKFVFANIGILLFMLYLLLAFGVTNCILWDAWIFIAMLVYTLLVPDSEDETREEVI